MAVINSSDLSVYPWLTGDVLYTISKHRWKVFATRNAVTKIALLGLLVTNILLRRSWIT